jgi:ribokinase
MQASNPPKIAVVGSINMDLVIRCQDLPLAGQTVSGLGSVEMCGGKGANQAVAAARAGGSVWMIGRTGDDSFGARLRDELTRHGADCSGVLETKDCASGLAIVAVESSGKNAILVVPNANGKLSECDIENCRSTIQQCDILLLQLEIPIPTVLAAIDVARSCGIPIILDPAPVPAQWDDRLLEVDLLCPNEFEASMITGLPTDSREQIVAVAQQLHQRGAKHVAITLGDQGTLLFDQLGQRWIAPFPVQAVDTTAAGDAFAGALAVFWASTGKLDDAARLANAAGALATTRLGAQQSMADRDTIISLAGSHP